ncbi:MAG: tetratricopeptide repeat protein [Planctomycetota bacterium]
MKKPLVLFACFALSLAFSSPEIAAQTIKESEQVREFSRAIQLKQFSKAREIATSLAKAPSSSRVQLIAADLLLRSGDAAGAVKQFDAYVEKQPGEKPYLWQRGIALYFVGRYKDGVEQFKIHRDVNPKDVENAAWHFLCLAKLESPEKARQRVLPAPNDSRPPMKEVLEMLKTGDTADVAEKTEKSTDPMAKFYGNFYLALHADALDQRQDAIKFMKLAVGGPPMRYMGDVARVYLEFLQQDPSKP